MSYTDENWEKTHADFVRQCISTVDPCELRKLIYQTCLQVINGLLKPESLINGLLEVVSSNQELIIILTDVLLLCDIETQISENKDQRDLYLWLLSSCSNTIVFDALLKERLDYETTAEARIVLNKKSVVTKFIKLKTRLFYKQQKFNLFREESEGYAKLITELCQHNSFSSGHMIKVLRSLIGCFNLDPNRVLDVVLECFECRPYLHTSFIPLLSNFLNNSSTLSQILAFKFGFYHEPTLVTPDSLYDVTAMLLNAELLSLEEIYPYLSPSDSIIFDHHKTELVDAKASARKATFVTNNDEKDEIKMSDTDRHLLITNNQKLGLCLSLLKVGDWKNAKDLISRLPDYYLVSHRNISKQLCSLVHYAIDEFYRTKSGLPECIISKIAKYKYEENISLKQAETLTELKLFVFPMITNLGPFLSLDTLLMAKIIRIGHSLMLTSSDQIKYDLLNVLDEAILPAMSLVESNCGLADELWGLLKCFPYGSRYCLYNNWKSAPTIGVLIKAHSITMKRIKYIMKRLSKENVKFSGRQIGKLSHSNPSFLFEYILSQIQCYDNLIGPVVDSLKYLTSVSFDVLVFCIIEALSDSNKDRTKHDGATISPWLLSLASFCGSVVKKYPVEIPGLLQFVANQLKAEKSLDLLILKEIIQKMAGIETVEEMTNEQLAAMSGGELLRQEGGYFNQVRNTRKSSSRLKDTLLELNLEMPLCILMAQHRNCILFSEQEHSHIKLIGKLYDQCQETLVQYGSFLASNLSIDDYIRRLPPLGKLITDYNLTADVAFFLVRPMIVHNVNQKFEELRKNERSSKAFQLCLDAWDFVTRPLVTAVVPAFPNKFWDDLSPRFFVTFWTLQMYDLEVPKASYDREVDRLKNQIQQTEDNKDLVASKKKKEVERCRLLQERLLEEQLKQDEHVRRVRQRLEKERDQWFQSKLAKMEMTTQFLQHCLVPRCIFTATDALYCAKFVHLLHTIKTPNFSTLICYDRIFGDISYTMSSCTENEANHYGRFLCALQETVMRWHKDKNIFEKECAKYPGFVTKFFEKDPVHVDYENYRHVSHKWHYRLTKAFILCLDSGDYVQIRNSLIVLTKLLPYFPAMLSFAQAIERRVENIRTTEKDKRPDLYALATGYSGQLKARKSTFVPESEFHMKGATPQLKGNKKEEEKRHLKPEVKKEDKDEEKKREKEVKKRDDKPKEKVKASPRKERGRSAEPQQEERDHKRRKVDAKPREEGDEKRDFERKRGDDSMSSSPSGIRNHDKKNNSSRKRDITELSPTSPTEIRTDASKRKKDEEKKKLSADERGSNRKPQSGDFKRSSTSRRNKSEDK